MKSVHKVCLAYLTGFAVLLLTARLGIWQWQRALDKSERMAQWTQAMQYPPIPWQGGDIPARYQRIILSGQWLLSQQILLDNRVEGGRPGFYVITPLLLTPSADGVRRIVAINRGWVAKPVNGLPSLTAPATQTVIVRHEPLPRFVELKHTAYDTPLWQNLDWARYQKFIGKGLQPMYCLGLSELGDSLQRNWAAPNLGESRNRAYAFQWFSLSLLSCGLMIYFTIRRYARLKTSPIC